LPYWINWRIVAFVKQYSLLRQYFIHLHIGHHLLLSRFKGIIEPFKIPIILISIIGTSLTWVFGAGINGQNFLIAMVVLVLSLVIISGRKQVYIMLGFIACILIIYLIQYFKPELIHNYTSESTRWFDSFLTTIYCSIFIYAILRFFRKNYVLENKRAEENEKKYKALNAEKDKFYSILAHDLRSPFNGLLGITQILAEELPNLSIETAQKMAVSSRNTTLKIYNLLENLLEWSRVHQGLVPFNPETLILMPIINDNISLAQEQSINKQIKIDIDFPDGLAVFADRHMLQTILRNLISNALKFTHQGGQMTIIARSFGDKSVEISVIDTGIGMSRTILDNLFRLDAQTNRKGTDNESSSGLGLLVCDELIGRLGGKLSVESEEGKGSRFTFTLPANRAGA